MLGRQVVAIDDRCVAPIGARETDLAAARRLHERRSDREAFARRCAEPRRRFRSRERQLLQNQIDVGRMAGEAARKIHLGLHRIAVGRSVGHLALVLVHHAGNEDMILEVLPDARKIGDRCDPHLLQLIGIADTRQHQ